MTALKFDYIFFVIFDFLVFWVCGYLASKGTRSLKQIRFWFLVSIPILSYSLIEGLRYARGVDYIFYKEIYQLSRNKGVTDQIIFDWLNHTLNLLSIPYYGAFIIYSFIFITCAVIFLRDYRPVLHYALPFFLAATLLGSETFIRQFLSISFVFIAIKMILEDKWIKFSVFCIIACAIHSSSVLIITLIIILKLYSRAINIYIAIIGYLFFAFVFDMNKISFFTPYLMILNFGDSNHFQSYINNADVWFSKDAINDIYTQSLPAKIANTLFDLSLIIIGTNIIKLKNNSSSFVLFFNLFVVGALLYQAFFYVELVRRLALVMYMFWFMIAAYSSFYFPYFERTKYLYNLCQYIIIIYILGITAKFIFLSNSQLFIWDI